MQGIPSYVAPIPNKVDGRQVIVFDRSQITFDYIDKASASLLQFRQFWLNGREFDTMDFVGNPLSQMLMNRPIMNVAPQLGTYSPSAAEGEWTNKVAGRVVNTNPGYYVKVATLTNKDGTKGYNYDYVNPPMPLTYKSVTGLVEPKQPQATTSEEWLLVNNSDMFHPFHIHISPFFVTEVGELNYANNAWSLVKLSDTKSPFQWVQNNWWDVLMIPPHGYVKFKTWINIPDQRPADTSQQDSPLIVTEDSNVYGSWVLHCHILRHEDRGMMVLVNAKPKPTSLDGAWIDDGGGKHQIDDTNGGLNVTDAATSTTYNGTFNQGIGNALFSHPWIGSMSPTTGILSFCVTHQDQVAPGNESMVLSNGHAWGRQKPASITFSTGTNGILSLSGVWVDGKKNATRIDDAGGTLTFTPQTPVWWARGTGLWTPNPIGGAGKPLPVTIDPKLNTGVNTDTSTVPPAVTPVAYLGTQTVINNAGQNQTLAFTVSGDLLTLVFDNGVKWTKQP